MATIKMHVVLDKNHVEWFNETFKGASLSWWLNLLMEKGKEAMTVTPEEYARIAAERLKEDLGHG